MSHDHDVSDVESDQPEVIYVHCPGCGEKVLDDDNFARGCTIDIRHWWHRGCLPPEIQELSDDTDAAFPCPLCQNLLHRTCRVCMMEEYTHSQHLLWVTCSDCQGSWHVNCLTGQRRARARCAADGQKEYHCAAC